MYIIIIVYPRVPNTHFTDLSVEVPSQVPPPSDVHPRPSAEGEGGGRGEPQLITQLPDRSKEGEKDFNSSIGPISLVGTIGAHRGAEGN